MSLVSLAIVHHRRPRLRRRRRMLVVDGDQIEPVGRRDRAGAGAVLRLPAPRRRPATGHLPSPTFFSVPTIERTWVCRNERAVARTTISPPARLTSRRSSVFTGDFAWHSRERKVVKSCLPTSACAAACIASASSGVRDPPDAAAIEGRAGRGGRRCGRDNAASRPRSARRNPPPPPRRRGWPRAPAAGGR